MRPSQPPRSRCKLSVYPDATTVSIVGSANYGELTHIVIGGSIFTQIAHTLVTWILAINKDRYVQFFDTSNLSICGEVCRSLDFGIGPQIENGCDAKVSHVLTTIGGHPARVCAAEHATSPDVRSWFLSGFMSTNVPEVECACEDVE